MNSFPFYKQTEGKDCGPTCLKIIAKYYGKSLNIQILRQLSETTRSGSNLLYISEAAEQIGFRTLGVKLSAINWRKQHYLVLRLLRICYEFKYFLKH